MASREAEALIQKYGGGWAADRANAEQIRQDAKAAGTWGVQQNSTLAFTPPKVVVPEEKKTSADKMWDRNSQTQKISETTRAKANYNTAKKQYDDYVNSAEYRQRLAENDQKARQQEVVNWFLPPEQRQAPKVIQDGREMYLRAAMEQAEAEFNRAEDAKVVASDLEAITGLSEEDRKELEQYAVNQIRDQNLPVEFQNSPFIKTAEQEASGLIGRIGQQRANELAETYMRQQNEAFAKDVAAKGAQTAGTGFWSGLGSSLLSVPISAVAGTVGTVGQLQGAARNTGRYKTLDPNATGTALQTYAGAIRGQVGQNISGDVYDENGNLVQDGGMFRGALTMGYQGLMSAADSIARAYIGGGAFGGAALAATNSFSQTMADASARGATPQQAAFLATTVAGIEALSEKIPLDNLIRTAKGGKQTLVKAIGTALAQAGIEATTEEISLIGTVLAEAAILQEKSSYQQSITGKMLNGVPAEEAKLMAIREILDEAVNTALVSMISGGVSSLSGSAFAAVQERNNQAPKLNTPEAIKQQTLEAAGKQETQKPAPAQQAPVQPTVEQTPVQEQTPTQQPQQPVETPVQPRTVQPTAPETQPQQTAPVTQTEPDTVAAPVQETPVTAQKATPEPVAAEPAPKQEEAPKANEKVAAAQQQAEEDEKKTQRDRPGDVRPMEVPKTDSFGKRVSELVGNAYGAEITTDKMANAIEELVQDGSLGFDVRHNQDSINKAAEQIAQRGVATTRNQITNAISKGKIRDGDVEKAILLYTMYNSKNTPTAIDNASEILVDLATMANITGRNLQMFRMLRQLTPEGQAMTIKKQVQKNIDSMIRSGAVKKGYTTEIDPELMAAYREAAQENMRAVSESQKKASAEKMQTIMDGIYAMEASKMPATMKAKWDAWRYMAMLGNAKTQLRNVAGNVLFVPYKHVKDRTAALAEKLFVPKDQRTKALFTDLELLEWARQDRNTDDIKNALKYSGKIGDDIANQKIRENMRVFDNKALDSIRKFIEEVPAAGDMFFKNGYYARSLADFMKARGYKAADIQNGMVPTEVLNEARSYAVQEAMKATFNDANMLSDFLATGIRYKGENPVGKVWNVALEGALPFRRTPANIAVRFEEYSPLGLINTAWKAVDHVRTGKSTAADVVDSLASSVTGSAAMALGYVLAKGLAGIKITGSNPTEDEERQGHQEYAIEFADKEGNEYSYKIDWAAPANLPLFVGANIYKTLESRGEDTDVSKFTSFLRGLSNAFEPMLALSCLSGVNDLLESVRYADEGEELYTIAAELATGYFTQGIPALLRQASQASQEVKRTTFSESNDPTIRDIESTLSGIPFYGENFKTNKVTAFGEKEKASAATAEILGINNKAARIIDAFLNPGTLKKIDNGALEQEITRLNKAQETAVAPPYVSKVISYTDKDGNYHEKHRLTEEQYQTIAQTQGQTAKRILDTMINSSNYKAMSDEEKAKAFTMVYSYAREKAMTEGIQGHKGYSESWMMELKEGKEADEILRRVTNSELNRTFTNLDTAWDSNYSAGVTESYSKELEAAYDSYSKMTADQKREVKAEATGNAAKYIEAREKGISHADFITTARNVNNVKGTGKNGTVRDIDRRQAIAKTTGLTPEEVDKLMRVYMADYDKTDDSPETTEFKYQYIREELDLSPAEYASTYKAYLDGEKKAGKIADIMRLGYDYKTANAIYKVHSGSMKQKLIAMYG